MVGGWTEPRQTRQHFGALLLGRVRRRLSTADRRLPTVYVGHTGTGFDGAELTRVWRLLKAREITESPFSTRDQTNERPHWVRPELVAQVRFTEWTDDNKLRIPSTSGCATTRIRARSSDEETRRTATWESDHRAAAEARRTILDSENARRSPRAASRDEKLRRLR